MPAYNAAKYIRGAVVSVLSQTYPSWELVIVDDCSTDETPPPARRPGRCRRTHSRHPCPH
ncbi:glycosyltransferase family 2 protein [Dyella terrae]|uniref:glycosyltransferase family 2 protein n=1 Tax=Dyella terrae TaxID=522259 RepID=UPI003D1893C8